MAGTARLGWLLAGLALLVSIGGLAATINVPGDYATIQAAIDAATPGDTIQVAEGTYNENVRVHKTVNLVGAPGAVLQGSGGNGFLIQAPNVSIQGFEVKGYAIGVRTYGGPSNYGDLVLEDMYVHSNTQNGILIVYDTFSSVTVNGCEIANNNQNGIGVANAAVIGALNILDTEISGNKSSGLYVASPGTTINGGLIQDTVFSGNTYQGLFVENGPVVSSLSIVGGAFSGNQLGLHTRSATINDLVVRGVQISGNTGSGMAIAGMVNGLLVEGCTFQNNPWEHLDLGLWTYSTTLNNVVIRGNTFGDGSWYSVYIFAPVIFSTGGVVVAENAFLKPWSWGVYNRTANLVLAYNNWWGSATGPNVVAYASANVVYSPWLGTSTSAPSWTFIVDDRGPISPAGYLQPALDAARNGDTILVKAGEYVTQGVVGVSVQIIGEPGAVVKSPGSQTYTIAESSAVFDPVIFAYGGTLAGTHVSGPEISFTDVLFLTVDGQNVVPPGGSRLVGILYRNVQGTIAGNTIRNLMPGGSGSAAQTFGILVYGNSVVDVIGNVVSDYSRGGIGVVGDVVGWARGPAPDPVANIVGNVVTGNGLEAATGWWAENGIQIGYGATGQIVGNVVSNHWVNNPYWTSTGILVVGSDDVSILDNLVFDNETSIAVMGLTAWGGEPANDNLIAGNTVLNSDWGISLQYDALNTTIERNVLRGNYVAVSSWGSGSAVPGGTLVRFNSIAGNQYGLLNYEDEVFDAALNWWGSPTGPWVDLDWDDVPEYEGSGDAVYGNVIYSPWLGTDPDGDPTQPGVQITGPMTIIVAPVGPPPAGGYLNMAIIGANELPHADTVAVRPGTYTVAPRVDISDDVSIIGAGPSSTAVRPGGDTGTSGDARAWFLVDPDTTVYVEGIAFDGSGYKIYQGFRWKGDGMVLDCLFTDMQYNASGPHYNGVAIAAMGDGNVDVIGCRFERIGRIGVIYFGPGIDGALFSGNSYIGKGDGNWLDYGVEVGGGASAVVLINEISENRGVAASDGSTSAGILVTDYYGPGTEATIALNVLRNNTTGIAVGYLPTDASLVTARYNMFEGNTWGVSSTGPLVDAALNWWGAPEGPTHAGNPDGAGDAVTDNVIYSPWLGTDPDGDPAQPGVQITGPMLIIVAPVGPEPTGGYLNTAIAGANELPYADTIEVRHGTYDASEPITGPVTLISQEGSASHTTLTGPMSLRSGGILVGLPLRGFTIMGDVTVEELVDAASSRINWSNVYGTITNKGTGTFDARYNYWGTQVYAVIDARTIGDIAVDPYLPRNADDSYRDIEALFTAGVAGDLDRAIDQLWAMARLGQDVNTFVQYLGVAGAGALGGPPPGAQIGAGLAGTILEEEVAGGAAGLDYVVDGVVVVGDAIGGHFTLTDPVTGQPIAKAVVTLSLLGEDGKLAFWGAATYDPTTGEYVFSIDTSRLAPGTYQLIIQAVDGQSATLTIEILAA